MNGINDNLKMLFEKIQDFVTTKTVVGEPAHFGDVTIVPLVDVTFGMGTGSGGEKEKGSGGAGGVGAKMSPSAILVISNGTVQLINVKAQDSVNKLVDMVPGILSKFDLSSLFSKKEKPDEVGE